MKINLDSRPEATYVRSIARQGTAAVELALLLPLLMLLLTVSVDFCRVFYHYSIVTSCARNAALYASDSTAALDSPYYVAGDRTQSIRNAALADAGNLNAASVTVSTTETASYVEVTVTYPVPMVSSYLGISSQTVGRTVRMSVAPAVPN